MFNFKKIPTIGIVHNILHCTIIMSMILNYMILTKVYHTNIYDTIAQDSPDNTVPY